MSTSKNVDTDYLQYAPMDHIEYNAAWRNFGPEAWIKLMSNTYASNMQIQTALRMMEKRVKYGWIEADKFNTLVKEETKNEDRRNELTLIHPFSNAEKYHAYEKFFVLVSDRPEMRSIGFKSLFHTYAQIVIDSPFASSEALLRIMEVTGAPYMALRAAAHKSVSIVDSAPFIVECCGYGDGDGLKFDVWPTDYSIALEKKTDEFLSKCGWDKETLSAIGFDMKVSMIAS